MFEVWQTNDVVRLAAAGDGFEMNAAGRPTEDLIRIAAAAGSSEARIVFRGLGVRPLSELIRIAAAGKGGVTFTD
jgi:hypothetical protein